MRATLGALLEAGDRGAQAADRLCVACVPLLGVDEAAISVIDDGNSRGTVGASSEGARTLDELQFTLGEGPCLEAARIQAPVLVADLDSQDEPRWPAFAEAVTRAGMGAVFAVPISVGNVGLGALNLFRRRPGPLTREQLSDAVLVAEAAAQAVLDLLTAEGVGGLQMPPEEAWRDLTSWARIEVYQATGMIIAQLDVSPVEALIRLRAYAYAHELSASDVAARVISRDLRMEE